VAHGAVRRSPEGPVFQQPNGNDMMVLPPGPAIGLPDPNPGVIPVMMPPAPGQKDNEALGTGTPIGPLSPVPPSWLSPSGMLPSPRDVMAGV
jgi:hypothetical protein